MADLIADGLGWLDQQRHAHLTRTVTYSDGSGSVSVSATVGGTEFEEYDNNNGLLVATRSRDYLIRAEDLVISASAVEPSRGHTITEVLGDRTLVCQVLPIGVGDRSWRWHDRDCTTYRIHTKVVSDS